MSGTGDRRALGESLSATQSEAIDRACDRFEAAWRAGSRPRIESLLDEADAALHPALFGELIVLEIHWRRRLGEQPVAAEYHPRFPDRASALAEAFARLAERTGAGPSPAADESTTRSADLGTSHPDATLTKDNSGSTVTSTQDDPARIDSGTKNVLYDGPRFRVLRPHARGGLGEVFVAFDQELNREVALKELLAQTAANPASRQRFLTEAEVTGGLEHPGIVPVYALGNHPDGRPYYATRFVRGDSLKQAIERFHGEAGRDGPDDPATADPKRPGAARGSKQRIRDSDASSLAFRQLLRRFVDVCNAIDYAHSRGALHRDIKPANIVLGKHGETLVVDWGLAKATGKGGNDGDERALVTSSASGSAETLPGSVMGTPAYMSPEQAAGDLESLGPACDIYSLGATLYSVLTGRPPCEADRAGLVLDRVRRGEFPKPRSVSPAVPESLEAICLKAMALKPADRYATPKALAEDIERWMADERVTAWREPFAVRAGRWMRRHKTLVATTAVSAPLLLVGTVVSGALAARAIVAEGTARLDRDRARTAETKAKAEQSKTEAALTRATEEQAKAKKSAAESRAVLSFFQNNVLAATRPGGQMGGLDKELTIRQAIDAAEPKIADAFKDQPTVEADVRNTIGTTYYYLGDPVRAIPQYERSLALREAKLGPDHPQTLIIRGDLAGLFGAAGRLDHAIALYESTVKRMEAKLGPDDPDTLITCSNFASACRAAGRLDDAIKIHEATLKRMEAKFGPNHANTLIVRNNLANAYRDAGRSKNLVAMRRATLDRLMAALGPNHPTVLAGRVNLAGAYSDAGQTADAAALLEQTLKLLVAKLGADHSDTLICRENLAAAYASAGRLGEALPLFEETVKVRATKFGPDHPDTLIARNNLAMAYSESGRIDEAIAIYETTRNLVETKLGKDHRDTLGTMNELARLYLQAKRWSDAEKTARACLAIRNEAPASGWTKYYTMCQLGSALAGQNHIPEAMPFLVGGYEGMKAMEATMSLADRRLLADSVRNIIAAYLACNKPEEAAEWSAKLNLPDLPANVFDPL
jgi:serine/threonine protein kinase